VEATLFWPAAVVRALSPARLLAVVLGLALTQLLLAVPLMVQQQPVNLGQPPWELVQALVAEGSARTVFWGLVLGALVGSAWGLVGGWIAWLEFRAQQPAQETLSALSFLLWKARSLCSPVLAVLLFVFTLVALGWVASVVNIMFPFGFGAVLLALLLPVLLLIGLVVVVCTLGCVALPIMPAATAAEGGDTFDALSRGFSYHFQRPLEYAGWWGLALVLAALPLLGSLSLARGEQPLVGPDAGTIVLWIGLVLSLSVFWSLQPLVYVKLRKLVDGVEETELWLGRDLQKSEVKSHQSDEGRGTRDEQEKPLVPRPSSLVTPTTTPESPASEPEKVLTARSHFTFAHTLILGNAGAPNKLVGLLPGLFWTALVLATGVWAASRLVEGVSPWSLAGQREVVSKLAQQRPLALVLIFLAVVVVASVGLCRPLLMIARMVAVRAVYDQEISLVQQALPFARRSGSQGLVSVLLLSAATVLFLATLVLAVLVWQDRDLWPELVLLGGTALGLGAIGSLGLGAVAVDSRRLEENAVSPMASYFDNGADLVASALAALVMGPLRWAALIATAALTWYFVCESLSWTGGQSQWVRWGLDGRLVPEAAGPLYWLASRIAGLWFFILFGVVLAYPLSYLLRWGVLCYLRCRQQTGHSFPASETGTSAEPIDLNEQERNQLLQGLKKKK
jgi:hypothetical protein